MSDLIPTFWLGLPDLPSDLGLFRMRVACITPPMPRSLKVRHELIGTVKSAVRRSGFLSQRALAEELEIALSTLGNFLAGKPVDRSVFEEICVKLSLDVNQVAEPGDRIPIAEIGVTNSVAAINPPRQSQQDWGEAPDVSVFYDRLTELATLESWIQQDRCRVIAMLGMGGMGKTALSMKLAEQIQDEFEYLIWRSLRNAPPILDLLADLIRFLSNQQEISLTDDIDTCILQLIHYFRSQRCLLILDNVESVLQAGDRTGQYLTGYEGYGQLLRAVGDTSHQSCLLLTSREKPKGFALREGKTTPVRSLQLTGLSDASAQKVAKRQGTLYGTDSEWHQMIQHYAGNPLALKIVATGIEDFLAGDIAKFLQYASQGILVFDNIRDLLEQQFQRLSDLEVQVMYWLAINREPVTTAELQEDLGLTIGLGDLLAALSSLQRRSLIESTLSGFTQQPVIMEFITEQLLRQSYQALIQEATDLAFLQRYALVKATAKDYIRESQIRLILEPLVALALECLGTVSRLEARLHQLLDQLRQDQQAARYAVGNIIHLFHQINADFTGLDLSHLQIWQADLSTIELHQANLSYAQVSKSVFAETFGSILSVAFSPDGQWLAIGESNGSIQIWEVASGHKIMTLRQHTSWVWFVIFLPHPQHPEQQILISASDDYQIKLWDLQSGACLHTLLGHKRSVNALALSPTGRWLASSSLDATICLWDLQNLDQPPHMLQGHSQRVWSIAFSPEGQTLASSSEDQTIKLWDMATGNCYQTVQAHFQSVNTVTFSADGTRLASGGYDQIIRIWQLEPSKLEHSTGSHTRSLLQLSQPCLQALQGHSGTLTALRFSPDGQRLASSSYDHQAKLWDVATGQCLKTLQSHCNRLWSICFNPSGTLLATGGDDRAVKLWDVATGQCLKTLQGHTNAVLSLAVASEGLLASGHEDETVKLWDPQTEKILQTLRGHRNRVWSVSFAPQATVQWLGLSRSESQVQADILISGSADHTIRIWNGRTGECLRTLHGHNSWVWSVACSPCGRYLASGSYDRTIKIWDIAMGACIKTLAGEQSDVTLSFSPDGQWLASSGIGGNIKLRDTQTYECLHQLEGHTNSVWRVVFNSSGKQLASASYDQTVRLWDVDSRKCLHTLAEHTAPVLAVVFGSDDRLITTGFDQTLRVWDTRTGQCCRVMQGHASHVSTLSLDSNSKTVYSGSFDETIRLWDIETGECLKILRPPRPYEQMNIAHVVGLTTAERENLKSLGAVER